MAKLKPVVFVQGKYSYNVQNTTQQIMLLNALKVTKDPNKLRDLIGVKTVADVYRTLDKIAMRKEYQTALGKHGMTFDYIVKNIKSEIDNAEKSSDRLSALNMILKSTGLDKYEDSTIGGGSWEDILLKINDEQKELPAGEMKEYDVDVPEMPEHIRLAKEKSNKESKQIYD